MVILQETWYRGDGPTGCPPGYRELVVPSTKLSGVKQGRDSGGKHIWYRADLTHPIKFVKTGTFCIWCHVCSLSGLSLHSPAQRQTHLAICHSIWFLPYICHSLWFLPQALLFLFQVCALFVFLVLFYFSFID